MKNKVTALYHDDFTSSGDQYTPIKAEAITNQKIKFAMDTVWPNHGFAEPNSFKTVESAIEYCKKVEDSCKAKLGEAMVDVILVNATALMRRHHISQVIKAMLALEPFESVRDKCCAAFSITIPEFYALLKLSECFTREEIFLFGMHGGSFSQIKCLAMIEDDSTRKLALNKYCEKITNVLDVKQRAEANKLLEHTMAVVKVSTPALMEGTDDQVSVDEDGNVVVEADPLELVPEQLRKAEEAVRKFTKVVALISPGNCKTTAEALENVHMTGVEAGTSAEQFANDLISKTMVLQKDVNALMERLTDVKQELDSVVATYGEGIFHDDAGKAEQA